MKRLIHLALTALFFLGASSAQNVPAIDVFGGYSYLSFQVPTSSAPTNSQRLDLNGWDVSASVGLFHHLAAEADFSGHSLSDCAGTTGLNCSNFSYLFGPRFTIGDRSSKLTFFVHGLVGQDRATINASGVSLTDTSIAAGGGAGVDYWLFRHVGIQLGPADYIFTRHLQNDGASNQGNFRVAGGIAFRFGGNFPAGEPKPPKQAKAEPECRSHRSLKRPWHKTKCPPSETQPTTAQPTTSAPSTAPPRQPAPTAPSVPSRGMPITSLGVVVAPQEFDGARILEIVPGGVAEMASLKPGDLIKSVDGKAVRTPMELAAELLDKSGKVRIGIMRGSFTTETVVLLGAR